MMVSLTGANLLRTLVRNHHRAVGITACRNLYTDPNQPKVGINHGLFQHQDMLKTRPLAWRYFSSNTAFCLYGKSKTNLSQFYTDQRKTEAVESKEEAAENIATDNASETAVAQTLFDKDGAINADVDMSTLTDAQLDQVARACLFETSKLEIGQVKGLEQYVADMKEDQTAIYYIYSLDDRWHMTNSPYARALVEKDIEVLYVGGGDEDVIDAIAVKGFAGIPLEAVETVARPAVGLGTVLRADGAHPHWPLRYRFLFILQRVVITIGVYTSAPFLLLGRFLYLHLLDRIENQKKRLVRLQNRAKRLTGKK